MTGSGRNGIVTGESLIADAVRAQQAGFHIFPIPPGEKAAEYRWSQAASNDLGQVMAWWQATPEANIGVACRQSGLFVIDCDVAKAPWALMKTEWHHLHGEYGQMVDGIDVLAAYVSKHEGDFDQLCDTYSVGTTRGGIHFYYRWTRTRAASQSSIVRGVVDVRTNGGPSGGGYVLAAGSRTQAGPYWVMGGRPLLDTPDWLADLVEEKPYVPRARMNAADRFMDTSGNFSGLERSVREAQEGNRSNALYWSARAMCADGADEDAAYDLLSPAAFEAGLSERDSRGTIRSAYRAQQYKEGIT